MTESKNVSVKTIAVALIGAGLLAFIGIGLWKAATPAPTPLQGQVDARTIEVAPKIPGRIEKVLVKEGDTVEAGAVMVKISIPEISAKLGQVTAQEQAAQAKARLVEEGARKEKIREAKSMYESTQGALKLAEKTFSRVNALYKEGLVCRLKNSMKPKRPLTPPAGWPAPHKAFMTWRSRDHAKMKSEPQKPWHVRPPRASPKCRVWLPKA